MIQILIADDHNIVRKGLRSILEKIDDMKIVAEAETGKEAVQLAQRLKPDVALVDINMPDTDGFSASIQIVRTTAVKVVIVTSQQDNVFPSRLMKIGVSGYVSKYSGPEILIEAIQSVYAGKTYFDIPKTPIDTDSSDSPFDQLSDREMQVALMVARGEETKSIAEALFLSTKTVNDHHRHLMRKLGLTKDVELTRKLLAHDLLDLDSVYYAPAGLKKDDKKKKKKKI